MAKPALEQCSSANETCGGVLEGTLFRAERLAFAGLTVPVWVLCGAVASTSRDGGVEEDELEPTGRKATSSVGF